MNLTGRRLGVSGEDAAAKWYLDHDYRILERNWRCREGEIDLIALRKNVIVFCEVKARSSINYGAPYEAVTWRKQTQVRRLARIYLASSNHEHEFEIRFDVASVLADQVELLEGVF